jgi:hypothetical protein
MSQSDGQNIYSSMLKGRQSSQTTGNISRSKAWPRQPVTTLWRHNAGCGDDTLALNFLLIWTKWKNSLGSVVRPRLRHEMTPKPSHEYSARRHQLWQVNSNQHHYNNSSITFHIGIKNDI